MTAGGNVRQQKKTACAAQVMTTDMGELWRERRN